MTTAIEPFSRRLGAFSIETRRHEADVEDWKLLRDYFVDWLGVTLVGSKAPASVKLRSALAKTEGACTIIGTTRKLSEQDAALLNGTGGHALDFDDSEFIGETHPSVVTFPAIFAIGEQLDITLADALQAAAVGFRILRPVGRALNPQHYGRGWHGTGTVGGYAAAAAVAALLNLDEDATTTAIALAASMMSGIQASFGTMAKPLNAGRASAAGLLAARLAQAGFTGPEHVFEARGGVLALFGGHDLSGDAVAKELADPAAPVSWLRLKQFPTCHCTHAAMRAAMELRQMAEGRPIRAVDVEVSDYALPMTSFRQPASEEEAKFSQSFAVATVLAKGAARREDFRGTSLVDEDVRRIEDLVSCRVALDLSEMEARVAVTLSDGSRLIAGDVITRNDDAATHDFVDRKFADNLASWSASIDPRALLATIDAQQSPRLRSLSSELRSFAPSTWDAA
jgi:2-methylcitrate dehydratase PrpD